MHQCMLEARCLDNSFAEKLLGFLVYIKLNMSQEYALSTSVESAVSNLLFPHRTYMDILDWV